MGYVIKSTEQLRGSSASMKQRIRYKNENGENI